MPELPSLGRIALKVFGYTVSGLALLYWCRRSCDGALRSVIAIWGKEPPIGRIYAILIFALIVGHMAPEGDVECWPVGARIAGATPSDCRSARSMVAAFVPWSGIEHASDLALRDVEVAGEAALGRCRTLPGSV